jgi:hypothetical protein
MVQLLKLLDYILYLNYLILNYYKLKYKYLLHKFRYFYRILHGNHTRIKGDKEFEIRQLKDTIESMRNQITAEQIKSAQLQDTIDLSKKERKLTWKERWSGKIKHF